jgi:hypothetical protein
LTRWALVPVAALVGVSAVAAGGAILHQNAAPKRKPVARQLDVRAMASLPTTPPAFRVRTPKPLATSRSGAIWAALRYGTVALGAPRRGARPVAHLSATTPEGTTTVVLVLRRKVDASGAVWDDVSLPVLPNGSTGWVRRSALNGYTFVDTHLYIDLRNRRLVLRRHGTTFFAARVGVGAPGTPTPTGHFYIRDRLTRYASPFYGPVAFGTSARSAVLTDWPAGGYIGIHGTDRPDLIPGAISHGCIRLRNRDIRRLAALMPVGTPVTISNHEGS